MSNVFPGDKSIPSEAEEKPIFQLNGHVFKTPAKHCRLTHVLRDEPGISEEWKNRVRLYLANFAQPVRSIAEEVFCFACGLQWTSHHGIENWKDKDALLIDKTTKHWESKCSGCGWPVRFRHTVYLEDGRPLIQITVPLAYHPTAIIEGSKILVN